MKWQLVGAFAAGVITCSLVGALMTAVNKK